MINICVVDAKTGLGLNSPALVDTFIVEAIVTDGDALKLKREFQLQVETVLRTEQFGKCQ